MSTVLSVQRWASLARDLALISLPGAPVSELDDVLKTYGLTKAELKYILEVPKFKDLLKKEREEFEAQGPNAGMKQRTAMLAQALSEKMFRTAMSDSMEHKESLKLLELLLKSSGLMEEKQQSVQVQTNVGVALPLPQGLNNPKLKHCERAIDV